MKQKPLKYRHDEQNSQRGSASLVENVYGLFSQWVKNQGTYNWHLILYLDQDGNFERGYIRQGGDLDTPLLKFSSLEDGIVELMGLLINA